MRQQASVSPSSSPASGASMSDVEAPAPAIPMTKPLGYRLSSGGSSALDELERLITDDHARQSITERDVQNKREILGDLDRFPARQPGGRVHLRRGRRARGRVLRARPRRAAVHASARDGDAPVSRVINITKGKGKAGEMQLVEVYEDPADYLLGTHGLKGAGGVFARSICTIRIPEWNDEAIASLHYYLRAVRATARVQMREEDEDRARAGRRFGGSPTGFSFVQALCDPWRERLGLRGAQHGNCSNWTSRGLFLAGLVERVHLFPKAIWADLFENHVLGGAPRRKLTRPAEVVYFERAVKRPGQSSRRAFPSVVSPIYLLRSFMYWRLPPFADAVVTVAPREEDGLLVARIAKGRAYKPRMLWAPVRHWHTIAVIALGVAYGLFGWLKSSDCDVAPWLSRVLLIVLAAMINGALYEERRGGGSRAGSFPRGPGRAPARLPRVRERAHRARQGGGAQGGTARQSAGIAPHERPPAALVGVQRGRGAPRGTRRDRARTRRSSPSVGSESQQRASSPAAGPTSERTRAASCAPAPNAMSSPPRSSRAPKGVVVSPRPARARGRTRRRGAKRWPAHAGRKVQQFPRKSTSTTSLSSPSSRRASTATWYRLGPRQSRPFEPTMASWRADARTAASSQRAPGILSSSTTHTNGVVASAASANRPSNLRSASPSASETSRTANGHSAVSSSATAARARSAAVGASSPRAPRGRGERRDARRARRERGARVGVGRRARVEDPDLARLARLRDERRELQRQVGGAHEVVEDHRRRERFVGAFVRARHDVDHRGERVAVGRRPRDAKQRAELERALERVCRQRRRDVARRAVDVELDEHGRIVAVRGPRDRGRALAQGRVGDAAAATAAMVNSRIVGRRASMSVLRAHSTTRT